MLPRLWWFESGGLHDHSSVCCDSVRLALRPKNYTMIQYTILYYNMTYYDITRYNMIYYNIL